MAINLYPGAIHSLMRETADALPLDVRFLIIATGERHAEKDDFQFVSLMEVELYTAHPLALVIEQSELARVLGIAQVHVLKRFQ